MLRYLGGYMNLEDYPNHAMCTIFNQSMHKIDGG